MHISDNIVVVPKFSWILNGESNIQPDWASLPDMQSDTQTYTSNLPVCAPDLDDQMRSTTGSYIPGNTLGPEIIGRYLPDNVLKCIFLKQNI